MRQCGIIAGCGMVALDQMRDRLAEDHILAQQLALGIARIGGLSIQPDHVETNIVFFEVSAESVQASDVASALDKRGVKVLALGERRLRAVTHFGIETQDITSALDALETVMA